MNSSTPFLFLKIMTIKKCFLGDEITYNTYSYGLGSVFVGGPRASSSQTSWRLDFIKACEKTNIKMALFIPEPQPASLHRSEDVFSPNPKWIGEAMAMATCVCFWFPKDSQDKSSYVDFGSYMKTDRIFYGRESAKGHEYLDWLMYKEHQLYPAESIDELVEMISSWVLE